MRIFKLNEAIDLTADSDEAFNLVSNKHPFSPGATVVLAVDTSDDLADVTVSIQGREDAVSAFATLNDVDGNAITFNTAGQKFFEFVLPQELNINVNEGTTGVGTASATLLAN